MFAVAYNFVASVKRCVAVQRNYCTNVVLLTVKHVNSIKLKVKNEHLNGQRMQGRYYSRYIAVT